MVHPLVSVSRDVYLNCEPNASPSIACVNFLLRNRALNVDRSLFIDRDSQQCYVGLGRALSLPKESRGVLESARDAGFIFVAEPFDDGDASDWFVPSIQITTNASEFPRATVRLVISRPDPSGYPSACAAAPAASAHVDSLLALVDNVDWSFLPVGSLESGSSQFASLIPPVKKISDCTSKDAFVEQVAAVKDSIPKVVLALSTKLTMAYGVDAAAYLLHFLDFSAADEGKRFIYLRSPADARKPSFVSLTPELLVSVSDNTVRTEAIAGTVIKGHDKGDEHCGSFGMENRGVGSRNETGFSSHASALSSCIDRGSLSDAKLGEEHGHVSDYVFNILKSVAPTASLSQDKSRRVVLRNMEHFWTKFVLSGAGVGMHLLPQLVDKLHPTPAVCGVPLDEAKRAIHKLELSKRGLYAGFGGVITSTSASLCVLIRSAYIRDEGKVVEIFAGAGITKGSVVEDEYTEIRTKMSQYVTSLCDVTRPVVDFDRRCWHQATHVFASFLVEELMRQGVGMFCVCPGSRSTPLAVAISENSAARKMIYVTHDERSAGYFALGCGKVGTLCAVVTTSGTAVANLLPAVCEAKLSNVPVLIISADRPEHRHGIGENQTMSQARIFSERVGFEKSFSPVESSMSFATLSERFKSMLSDVSFAVGEVCFNRRQCAHLNWHIHKPDMNPTHVYEEGFNQMSPSKAKSCKDKFCNDFDKASADGALFSAAVRDWCFSGKPFVSYDQGSLAGATCPSRAFDSSFNSSLPVSVKEILEWHKRSRGATSALIICGELLSWSDSRAVSYYGHKWKMPVLADCLSLLHGSSESHIVKSLDLLVQVPIICDMLFSTCRVIIRVGGSIISGKLDELLGQLKNERGSNLKVIRVTCGEKFNDIRHDTQWIADSHVQVPGIGGLSRLFGSWDQSMEGGHSFSGELLSTSVEASIPDTPSWLAVTRVMPGMNLYDTIVNSVCQADSLSASQADSVSSQSGWTEPRCALELGRWLKTSKKTCGLVYLSASMPPRDFDNFSHLAWRQEDNGLGNDRSSTDTVSVYSQHPRPYFFRVLANRVSVGIDGVTSSFVGSCHALSRQSLSGLDDPEWKRVVYLGDLAALHDVSGITMLAGKQPGSLREKPVGKMLAINNAGGAIFQFLPISASPQYHKYAHLFETRHGISIGLLGAAIEGRCSGRQEMESCPSTCSSPGELQKALSSDTCCVVEARVTVPYDQNVALHRGVARELIRECERVAQECSKDLKAEADFELDTGGPADISTTSIEPRKPLIVYLPGWLGDRSSFDHLKRSWSLSDGCRVRQMCVDYPIERLSRNGSFTLLQFSLSAFCVALRELLKRISSCDDSRQGDACPVALVGYSMGGRIAAKYKSMFPEDSVKLVLISAVPQKRFDGIRILENFALRTTADLSPKEFVKKWCSLDLFGGGKPTDEFSKMCDMRLQVLTKGDCLTRDDELAGDVAGENQNGVNSDSLFSGQTDVPHCGSISVSSLLNWRGLMASASYLKLDSVDKTKHPSFELVDTIFVGSLDTKYHTLASEYCGVDAKCKLRTVGGAYHDVVSHVKTEDWVECIRDLQGQGKC